MKSVSSEGIFYFFGKLKYPLILENIFKMYTFETISKKISKNVPSSPFENMKKVPDSPLENILKTSTIL